MIYEKIIGDCSNSYLNEILIRNFSVDLEKQCRKVQALRLTSETPEVAQAIDVMMVRAKRVFALNFYA